MANDSLCFLEQTDFSLLLARGAAGSSPFKLEALQEVPLADAAALSAAVGEVFATGSAGAVCSLRPKLRALHLATADEARRFPGLGGVRQLATAHTTLSTLPPAWLAAVSARDGAAPGAAPWLASLASAEGHAASTALLGTLSIKPARSVSATLNAAGAIATTISAPIWLLEIGERSSHALLISRDGVLAAGRVSLNLDRLAEAVQAELGLKFRGSAIKLFFNPVYDYTEVGPRIAARLATVIKPELTALRGANRAPIALACIGLPAAQHWFATQLAAALELAAFAPEPKALDLSFATPELEATVSPAWFGFLRLASAFRSDAPAPWDAEWLNLETIALPVAPKPATPAPAPAPAPVPAPAPAVVVAPAPKPAPAAAPVPTPAAVAPKPAAPVVPASFPMPETRTAAVDPRPVTPAPAPTPTPRAAASATPVATPAPKPAAPSPASAPAPVPIAAKPVAVKPATPPPAPAKAPVVTPTPATAKPAAAAPVAKPAPTASAVNYSAKPTSPEKSPAPKKPAPPPVPIPVNTLPMAEIPPSRPFFKNPVVLIMLVVIVLLGGGGYLYFESQKAATRLAEEKARTDERLQVEIAKNRASEQKAQAEVAARKKAEAQAAQRIADAEAGRQRAEAEAHNSTVARLANARGTLVIATDPVGAMITVGTLAPRPSPATFSDLKIGKYPVSIALDLYDTAQLELEVKEDATTDTGVIKLNKILGSLELISDPPGVSYEVKPANTLFVSADARRTGRTPDTLTDLIPGDYTITFARDGWMPQVETVTVARDSMAHAKGVFPNGIVKISSKPAGGVVTRDGVRLGVTPLVLNDQLPGDASYLITLAGYAPEPVNGRIVGGQVLQFNPVLETYDHLSKLSELDQQPKVISTVQPKLPYEFKLSRKSAKVNVELTVTRDGSTKDLEVLPGSDHNLSLACLAAAAQWKFRPGSIHGRAANVRLIVPFNIEATE